MYPSTKFEEIEIIGPNLSKKHEEQKFRKINIKMVISINQCTPVPNFS